MAEEMIDRVATVLFPQSMAGNDNSSKRYARSQARLAIEAMREPTEAMEDAGRTDDVLLPGRVWYAMIDEALK